MENNAQKVSFYVKRNKKIVLVCEENSFDGDDDDDDVEFGKCGKLLH